MDNYTDQNKMKLGFGLMRLPKLEDGQIDVEQVKEMVDLFLDIRGAGAFLYIQHGVSLPASGI